MDNSYWAYNEKYQPSTIDELALYPALNKRLRKYVHTGRFPNLMFFGEAGTGKTTAAKILANSIKNGNVEMIDFGGSRSVKAIDKFLTMTDRGSLFSGRIFILDEFHDVPEANQRMIKKTIEDRDRNRYIFCVNDIQKVHPPIFDRCSKIQFDYCELNILDEVDVLEHTGWDGVEDWKTELKRVSKIMAGKAGKTITDGQFDRVFAIGARYVNVRSFILHLEEVITDDEFDAEMN